MAQHYRHSISDMKMLMSTADEGRACQARTKLFRAGIPCEIRQNSRRQWDLQSSPDAELWVCHDGDVITAMKVLAPPAPEQLTLAFGSC